MNVFSLGFPGREKLRSPPVPVTRLLDALRQDRQHTGAQQPFRRDLGSVIPAIPSTFNAKPTHAIFSH